MNFEERVIINGKDSFRLKSGSFENTYFSNWPESHFLMYENIKMRSPVFSALGIRIQTACFFKKSKQFTPHYFNLPLLLLQKSKILSSSSSISSTSSNDQSQSLNAKSSNLQQEVWYLIWATLYKNIPKCNAVIMKKILCKHQWFSTIEKLSLNLW